MAKAKKIQRVKILTFRVKPRKWGLKAGNIFAESYCAVEDFKLENLVEWIETNKFQENYNYYLINKKIHIWGLYNAYLNRNLKGLFKFNIQF